MASFTDVNGKKWNIFLDAPTIRTVRSECQVDLIDAEGTSYGKMVDDPCLLVDVLWVLCRKQAEAANITDEQFGASLVGDAIEGATAAMLNAVVDFFPRGRRQLQQTVAAKNQRFREVGTEKALAKINDPELEAQVVAAMEAKMDEEIRKVLSDLIPSSSATNTPVTVVSSQKDEHSGS